MNTFRKYARYALLIPLLIAGCQSARFMLTEGWQHTEVSLFAPQLTACGFPTSLSELGRALDWELLEYEPRLSRPLGNVVQLFEAPFRAMLWRFVRVPASLSLTWPMSWFAAPLLLFLLLEKLGVDRRIALLAVAIYVANPGVLSLEVMFFRPGKAVANGAILLCLYLAARQDAWQSEDTSARRFNLHFAGLCVATLVGFLFDEVALVIFPAIFLMFPKLVLRSRATMAMFATLPMAYVGIVVWGMPVLTRLAGYPDPNGYCAETYMTAMLSLRLSAEQYGIIWGNILGNAQIVFEDSFGLVPPALARSGYYSFLFYSIVGCAVGFVLLLLLRTWNRLFTPLSTMLREVQRDQPWARTIRAALTLAVALLFEGMLMSVSPGRIEPRVWGLYYYGVFCVIFLVLVLALAWQALHVPSVMAWSFTLLLVCATTFVFPATNQAYKDLHYYPYAPYRLANVFKNEENRFDFPRSDVTVLWRRAGALRGVCRTHKSLLNVPSEMVYALYELGLTNPPNPNRSNYFDLTWKGDVPTCVSHD